MECQFCGATPAVEDRDFEHRDADGALLHTYPVRHNERFIAHEGKAVRVSFTDPDEAFFFAVEKFEHPTPNPKNRIVACEACQDAMLDDAKAPS